jgi:hypothetical protein
LTALAGITDASAANPYVVKLDCGEFDVGNTKVTLPDYVDLEGSGQDATTIIGTSTGGIISMANNEVRELRVRSHGDSSMAINCMSKSSSPSIREVTIEFPASSGWAWGIFAYQTDVLTLERVTVVGTAVQKDPNGSRPSIVGVSSEFGNTIVHDLQVQLTSQGGPADLLGLEVVSVSALTVRDSDIHIDNDGGDSQAFFIDEADASFDDVTAVCAHSPNCWGLLGVNSAVKHTVDIERSTISGLGAAIAYSNSSSDPSITVQISDSELDGAVVVDTTSMYRGPVTFHCVDDHGASFEPLSPTCQPMTAQPSIVGASPSLATSDGPAARIAAARAAQRHVTAHY